MDQNRSRIFAAYAAPVFCGVLLDLGYAILFRPLRYHRLTEFFPIAAGLGMTLLIVTNDFIKPLSLEFAIQSTGEMYCNYDIMKNYPEKKWTIVSSTDSLQLILHKGWHQEVCTFLGKMHNMNADTTVTIPTKYVFFYIEKYPIQYGASNNVSEDFLNLGYVSEEDAAMPAIYEKIARPWRASCSSGQRPLRKNTPRSSRSITRMIPLSATASFRTNIIYIILLLTIHIIRNQPVAMHSNHKEHLHGCAGTYMATSQEGGVSSDHIKIRLHYHVHHHGSHIIFISIFQCSREIYHPGHYQRNSEGQHEIIRSQDGLGRTPE